MRFCAHGNQILEKKKIELHYEIEGYDRGEIEEQDLAKILIGILNWGENLVKRRTPGNPAEDHRSEKSADSGMPDLIRTPESDEPEAVSADS